MQNAVNQRINLLRKHLGLDNTEFATSVGIRAMSTYHSRKQEDKTLLTVDELITAHRLYRVNLNWIMLGQGEMIEGQVTESEVESENLKGLDHGMIEKRFSELVIGYQKRNKLQLNELASKIKHSYTHVHAVVTGKKPLTLPILSKGIIVLDLDANFIFKGKISATV